MDRLRYTAQELAELGDAIYDREVAPRTTTEDRGRFVAIDVVSGDYEIDANETRAVQQLRARKPEAQFWLRRIGSRYTHRFGYRIPPRSPGQS